VLTHTRQLRSQSTVEVENALVAFYREHPADALAIDLGAMGAGVFDHLRARHFPVIGIDFGAKALDDTSYVNARAEMYGLLREDFRAGQIAIDRDEELLGQLTGQRFFYDNHGRMQLESKEQMRRRGLPSPDKADALAIARYGQTMFVRAMHGGGDRWHDPSRDGVFAV